MISLKVAVQNEVVDSEQALFGNDDSGIEYNPVLTKNKQRKKSNDDDCKVLHEKDLKNRSLKAVPKALGIDGIEIPYNPIEIKLDTLSGVKENIIISEDFDHQVLIKLNEDRLKNHSLVSEVDVSSISERLVKITCYGFDKDIYETCINRFSRFYKCKSSIIDSAFIERGIIILESIIDYSGYNKYIDLAIKLKDTVKLNRSIDFDIRPVTGGNANCIKTFNIPEITRTSLQDISYRTGISDSNIAHICCLLSLSFSHNTIDNIKWFKKDFIDGENNFAKTKVLKWFTSNKGIVKDALSKCVVDVYNDYMIESFKIRSLSIESRDISVVRNVTLLYDFLRKLERMKMTGIDVRNQLKIDKSFIRDNKRYIKIFECKDQTK